MLLHPIPVPKLSPVEWHAIAIALRDADASTLCPSSKASSHWNRVVDFLLARRRPMPLADPRLEALRQFVCATRRRRDVADDMVPSMLEQGYSRSQIEAIALLSA